MIRRKTELCLLCQSNQADKTKSHIIPKFMTKSMFQDGKTQKAYTMSNHNMHKPIPIAQDTPKQDYILCSKCETYFGVLETYFANQIHRTIRDIRFSHLYMMTEISTEYSIIKHTNANLYVMFLLIYSIIWRCHISDHNLFKNFSLPENEVLRLKNQLLVYKSVKQSDLLEQLKTIDDSFDFFPYLILTPKIHKSRSKNFLFANPTNYNPVSISAAEYLIYMFSQPITDSDILQICNSKVQPPTLVLVNESNWDNMRTKLVQELASTAKAHLDRNNQTYYGIKNQILQ